MAPQSSGHLLPPWPRVGHRNRFEGWGEGLPFPPGAPSTIEITSVDAPRGGGGDHRNHFRRSPPSPHNTGASGGIGGVAGESDFSGGGEVPRVPRGSLGTSPRGTQIDSESGLKSLEAPPPWEAVRGPDHTVGDCAVCFYDGNAGSTHASSSTDLARLVVPTGHNASMSPEPRQRLERSPNKWSNNASGWSKNYPEVI